MAGNPLPVRSPLEVLQLDFPHYQIGMQAIGDKLLYLAQAIGPHVQPRFAQAETIDRLPRMERKPSPRASVVPAGEVCWRLSSRWREENYFRYARTRFALDALDSYAANPDDPDRMVPNPAKKTAAARVRHAEAAAQAAEAARDAALLQLRSPALARPPASPTR